MSPETKLKFLPWIVGLGLFIENIDVTVINTSLSEISKSLHVDPLDLKIAITSYLLMLAVLIPISGYIADKIGTKKTFSFAIIIFMVGSLICGTSTSLFNLIIGRLIQGVGGAVMAPVGRLILVKIFPRSKFVQAFSYVVIVGQLGTAIGPPVGGLITNFFDWRYIFFINIPIGLCALILVNIFMTNIKEENISPFDWKGFLLFGLATSLIMLPITLLTERIHTNYLEYSLLLLGVLCLYLYYRFSKTVAHPTVDLTLFKIRTYRLSTLGNLLSRTAIDGIPFLLPLLFQLDFKLSILASSLLLLPYGIGFLCAKFVLKKALNYFGFKKFLIVNTLCLSIILLIFASITASSNLLFLNILIFILGGLVSLQFSSMSIMNYVDVEAERLSKATSLSSVVQQVSLGFGVCLVAILLTFFDPIAQNDNFIALVAFQDTFYILSGLVILALFVFARLDAEDGSQVLESDKTVAKA